MSTSLRRRINIFALAFLLMIGCGISPGMTEEMKSGEGASLSAVLWQPFMNVFRRFEAAPADMFAFYGDVLGFEQLDTYSVEGGTQVARFQVGPAQLKLTERVPDRQYRQGGVQEATGLRLLTFFFPDEEAVTSRFVENGYAAPDFRPHGDTGRRSALVQDPDGQWVQLIIAPDAPAETFDALEIGLTVSDPEVSRAFYRDFVGLEVLPPEDDPVFGTTKYRFRNGTTTISLRSFGSGLPKDTGSGGIQYVVSDVARVDALARARGVAIDQPLSTLRGFGVKVIWLEDPDGITNYFAETPASREATAASAAP